MKMQIQQPKFHRGRPIIQPGETYEIDGVPHTVVTATSEIIAASGDNVAMTDLVFWLDNLSTGKRIQMPKKELEEKFKTI